MAKSGTMGRTGRDVWEKRVERLRDSDMTDGEFAAEIGVNVNTLKNWKWKLAAEQRAMALAGSGERGRKGTRNGGRRRATASRKTSAPRRATFVEVELAPAEKIELRIGGIEVAVPVGFDEMTLSRVVAVLRRVS